MPSVMERMLAAERFRILVDAAPAAALLVNAAGEILLANRRVESTFGYAHQELVGQPVEILVPLADRSAHPVNRESYFANPTARAMGEGRELFGVHKSGRLVPVEIGLSPVETDGERLVLATIVDISARHAAERALRESEASLREANESLTQYAYVVSHDIRAPLRAIRNYVDFLREDLQGQLQHEQQTYLEGMAEAVDQAERMVEDLLLLSQLDRCSQSSARLCLRSFIDDLLHMLPLPSDVQIVLAVEHVVQCDPTLLRQVLQNLILNAVKFNNSATKRIDIRSRQLPQGQVELAIADNGIGIAAHHQEQIFKVFQRLHSTEEYEGTGIGLAIVRKAIQKLGAQLRLESQLGQGSTFLITLPACDQGASC